jgi:sarcosine oxidase subunit gamma
VTAELLKAGFPVQLGIRAEPGSPAAAQVGEALGVPLPLEPNTVASAGGVDVLWLGPDEWLAVGSPLREAGIEGAALVELSANRVAFELSGPGSREVLASCCALDLHPRAFGEGRCAQTLLAQAQVIVQQTGPEAFRILVRPSFAAYVAAWLEDGLAGANP